MATIVVRHRMDRYAAASRGLFAIIKLSARFRARTIRRAVHLDDDE